MGCATETDLRWQEGFDRFFQAPNNQLDVLWVVDDSSSMQNEQDALADGFTTFTEQLEASGTDFHIGVTTTSFEPDDDSAGALIGSPTYVTNNDDYGSLLPNRARVGLQGSDMERGIGAALWALGPVMTGPGGMNEGFLRDEANLLVVFVSDEEDCTDDGALFGQRASACYENPDQLVAVPGLADELRSLKADPNDVTAAGIIGPVNGSCDDAYPARRYRDMAMMTGGTVGDICEGNWSDLLENLGMEAVGVQTRFRLQEAAEAGSLSILVDGEPVVEDSHSGFTYDPLTCYLQFHGDAVPERDAEITASYTIAPGSSCI